MYGQLLLSDTYNEAGNVVHSQSTTMSRFFKISININIIKISYQTEDLLIINVSSNARNFNWTKKNLTIPSNIPQRKTQEKSSRFYRT